MQKVVVITGASSGIGKALALLYHSAGYIVVLAARKSIDLLQITAPLPHQERILCITCDVTLETDCEKLIANTLTTFGKIDILICNAGITMRALLTDTDIDVVKQVMDVNFYGALYCIKHALPHLIQAKGSLVGISSIAGYVGLPGRTGYSASKFALQGLLEVVRNENLKNGLHVLTACPGFTQSNIRKRALTANGQMQAESPRDEQKMMTAEEVASHIFAAVANRKRDLILTKAGKMIVWLHKFFPTLADKIVYNQMAKEQNAPIK